MNENKELKGIFLAIGSLGFIVCLFLLIASALSIFKISKMITLTCALISLVIFHEGLAEQVQKRIRRLAKYEFQQLWRSLQMTRQKWCGASV
ncbi:hypothetical protein [Planctobacterium marinum]|uniref:Uncharacterized protein n=1 Tax=Planctobacterium marinum TaxID=1631968 RepID=A0AA48HQP4_9ALTE|nr:hypothetical protein MACH26_17450 [Planctobacterium marinum]